MATTVETRAGKTNHQLQIRRMPGPRTEWIIACITHRNGCSVQARAGERTNYLVRPDHFYAASEAIAYVVDSAQKDAAGGSEVDAWRAWRVAERVARQIAHGKKRVRIGPLTIHALRRDGTITLVLLDHDRE